LQAACRDDSDEIAVNRRWLSALRHGRGRVAADDPFGREAARLGMNPTAAAPTPRRERERPHRVSSDASGTGSRLAPIETSDTDRMALRDP